VVGLLLLVSPAVAATFSDVYSDTYNNPDYPEAVSTLSDLGVITGFTDGTFKPHDPVTRQQFAKMIVKLLGFTVTGDEHCPFVDVATGTSPSDPFYPDKYIAVCAANGVTQGVDATHFAPYNNITRAQVISMVVRAAQRAGIPLETPSEAYYAGTITNSVYRTLTDANHGLNIQIAEFNNLFWGIWPDQGNTWNVYGKASRGEVAQIMWRLWQKMGSQGSTTTTTRPPSTTTTTRPPSTTTTTLPSDTLEFSDDFSSTASGWGNVTTWNQYGKRYYYQNGRYVVEIQPVLDDDDQFLPSTIPWLDLADYWVEADITFAAGDDKSGCGLFVRYQDRDNFYEFEFDGEGYCAIYKRVDGDWTNLTGWVYSPAIYPEGTSNYVVFSAFGGALTASVNGTIVCTATDYTFSHGTPGFYAGAMGYEVVKAIFDNLQVWSSSYIL
jgi:hypothetical protein